MFTKQDLWMIAVLSFINIVVFIIPCMLIVRRIGHSGWWMLINFVPLGIVAGLWLLALGRWPALERPSN